MLNIFGESVIPLIEVDFYVDMGRTDQCYLFSLDDSGWLMYPNLGLQLLPELDLAGIKYSTHYINSVGNGGAGSTCVRVEDHVRVLIDRFMKNQGFADLALHQYLIETLK